MTLAFTETDINELAEAIFEQDAGGNFNMAQTSRMNGAFSTMQDVLQEVEGSDEPDEPAEDPEEDEDEDEDDEG